MNVFRRGMKYYKKYTFGMVMAYVFMFTFTICNMLLPQATQLVIDRVIYPMLGGEAPSSQSSVFLGFIEGFAKTDYLSILLVLTAIVLAIVFIQSIGHYVRWNVSHNVHMRGANDNRTAGFSHFLAQSPLVLNKYTSGELLNFFVGDVEAVRMGMSHHIPMLISSVSAIILSAVFLVRINPFLAISPLTVGVIIFIIARRYNEKMRGQYGKIREANVNLNTCIQENINGVRIIRSFATEKQEIAKFNTKNDKFRDAYVDLATLNGKFWTFFRMAALVVSLVTMIVGIVLVTNGWGMTVGEFTTSATYATTISSYMMFIATVIGNLQNSVVCGTRELDFIDEKLTVENSKDAIKVGEKPELEFRNVSLVLDGKNALDNVSFKLPYGSKVGIMGKTGSGKTVIMKLLNRFYDVSSGEILIDGKNVKDYELDSVRRSYSYVMQDVFLFSDTVKSNVGYCDGDVVDEDKVDKCVDYACAERFVAKLEKGKDTIVGERGVGLSGGQKQRLSIARALYKNAPVIMLDDCTSALDYTTEKKIVATLGEKYFDRTVIISTHRANSVAFCDIIIYLDGGRIAEMGTPSELIERKGLYYTVLKQQETLSKED